MSRGVWKPGNHEVLIGAGSYTLRNMRAGYARTKNMPTLRAPLALDD